MIVTALLLYGLVVTDAAFCGFRAAIGRDGRIRKFRYYRAAALRGCLLGHAAIAVAAAVAAAVLALAPEPDASWQRMLAAGDVLVRVYGVYATTVLVAFVPYLLGGIEARTLAAVSVFGPLTLVRPWVIALGGFLALAPDPDRAVAVSLGTAVVAQLCVEPILARRYAARFAGGEVLDPEA